MRGRIGEREEKEHERERGTTGARDNRIEVGREGCWIVPSFNDHKYRMN